MSRRIRFDVTDATGRCVYEDSVLRPVSAQDDYTQDTRVFRDYYEHKWCWETSAPGRFGSNHNYYRTEIKSLDEFKEMIVVR